MARKLKGKKVGMTQVFDDLGNMIPCTVIQVEPNVVTQIKTSETDGYTAIQLGYHKVQAKDPRRKEQRTTKPLRGHFAKAGTDARRHLFEVRVDSTDDYTVGQELGVDIFEAGQHVDVTGTSIGKGYQGVMKKFGFAGGPAAHGSGFHRHAGSTGMRSTPGRCLPGGKRASQMGNVQVTAECIPVLEVNPEEGVILVKGQIPGPRNGIVMIAAAQKKK